MRSMFRTQTLALVVTLFVVPVSVSAQVTDASIGTWKLNVAKSTYDPGPPPKSETRSYSQDGFRSCGLVCPGARWR